MRHSPFWNRFIRTTLLVLWGSTVCINPVLAAELEVDELIESIRGQILAAEKRATGKPMFGVKEVKLSISYAIEKKGEAGFKAFVITAGASVSSHAVQVMEITLTPLKDLRVEKQSLEEKVGAAKYTEKYTDFRGRTYSVAELERALLPDLESQTTRGVGRQSLPTKASVGLNIFFESNSDRILPKHYADLDKLGTVLARHAEGQFRIEGHTDNVGSDSYNQTLSEKRAESVKQYLVQHFSIAPERLITKGYGKSHPRGPNDTPEGRSLNRRVEIVNLGER